MLSSARPPCTLRATAERPHDCVLDGRQLRAVAVAARREAALVLDAHVVPRVDPREVVDQGVVALERGRARAAGVVAQPYGAVIEPLDDEQDVERVVLLEGLQLSHLAQ